ncbi:hypothetical protein SEA_DAKITI_31 [Gordonia phage Dakiti]|uniref:Uncharacterized protein n=1 Tax=Gordonia phage Chelms TaxID=2588132 RepID=A0A4Y6EJQ3_9CAUD|nr:hypothetical protein HWC24_gp098 [Gordonia phage Chelms]QDF18245.1 hypothetical protein SEA_CHELMS_31 [Gordonia phage Chelms]QOR56176.1 hypothetical protein SEA_LINETTI_32 [Gordonia phage Linetti]WIC40018.1 hypothetical protein SEA_DAKITI_31 [Gordonia phage Dakiti]
MIEQQTVTFDTLPGVTIRLTRGHEEYGDDFITAEAFDQNMNIIPGGGGGFRGPSPQAPVIVEPDPEPESEAPDVPPEEVLYASEEGNA